MISQFREIKPGEVFYRYGRDKIHFIGAVQDPDTGDRVFVFWEYLRHKQRRLYTALAEWELEILWKYLWKTRTIRKKLIY